MLLLHNRNNDIDIIIEAISILLTKQNMEICKMRNQGGSFWWRQSKCLCNQENKTENSSVYKRELRIGIFLCIEKENSILDT